jgi:hypothetical protein
MTFGHLCVGASLFLVIVAGMPILFTFLGGLLVVKGKH